MDACSEEDELVKALAVALWSSTVFVVLSWFGLPDGGAFATYMAWLTVVAIIVSVDE